MIYIASSSDLFFSVFGAQYLRAETNSEPEQPALTIAFVAAIDSDLSSSDFPILETGSSDASSICVDVTGGQLRLMVFLFPSLPPVWRCAA